MKFDLVQPCLHCPFRTDVKPYLRPARVREIESALVRSTFGCHETVDYSSVMDDSDDEDPPTRSADAHQHCAGALILLEKMERPSQMMRIAERIGMYDRRRLRMDSPVFDDFDDMEEAQS